MQRASLTHSEETAVAMPYLSATGVALPSWCCHRSHHTWCLALGRAVSTSGVACSAAASSASALISVASAVG